MTLAKILLADGDQRRRKKWRRFLETAGFDVIEAANFLEVKGQCRQEPDLAVVDLQISQAGGSLMAGRAIDKSIPTIIVTESAVTDQRDFFRQKPGYLPPAVDVHFSKEEGLDALLKAVHQALRPRVFVAHGHDLKARDEVREFLMDQKFRPVILSDRPEEGRTIIEKFEDYSDVSFAIILLTPDDVGGTETSVLKPRARQNVIFELGYFFGKLGRKKVVALCKQHPGEELEMPSNYSGILYLDMDSTQGWKRRLADEMIAAGFDIDLEQILRS